MKFMELPATFTEMPATLATVDRENFQLKPVV